MEFLKRELENIGCSNLSEMGSGAIECVQKAIENLIQKIKEDALLHSNQQVEVDESHPFIKTVRTYGQQLMDSLNGNSTMIYPSMSSSLLNLKRKLVKQ